MPPSMKYAPGTRPPSDEELRRRYIKRAPSPVQEEAPPPLLRPLPGGGPAIVGSAGALRDPLLLPRVSTLLGTVRDVVAVDRAIELARREAGHRRQYQQQMRANDVLLQSAERDYNAQTRELMAQDRLEAVTQGKVAGSSTAEQDALREMERAQRELTEAIDARTRAAEEYEQAMDRTRAMRRAEDNARGDFVQCFETLGLIVDQAIVAAPPLEAPGAREVPQRADSRPSASTSGAADPGENMDTCEAKDEPDPEETCEVDRPRRKQSRPKKGKKSSRRDKGKRE